MLRKMELKIFLLIATFSLVESRKINRVGMPISEQEKAEVLKKPNEFPSHVFLNSLFDNPEENPEFLSKCYGMVANLHATVINKFSYEIVGAMNEYNRRLPSEVLYKRLGQNIRTRTEDLQKLLEQYEKKFSEEVKNKVTMNNMKELTEKYKNKIFKELSDIFMDLFKFRKGVISPFHIPTLDAWNKKYQDEVEIATKKLKEIIEAVKSCVKGLHTE